MTRVLYDRSLYSYLKRYRTDESVWQDSKAASLLRKAVQGDAKAMMALSDHLRLSTRGESEELRIAIANFWEGRSLFFTEKDWLACWLARHSGEKHFRSLTVPSLCGISRAEGGVFHQLGLGEATLNRLTPYHLELGQADGTPFLIATYVSHEDRDEGGFGWETELTSRCLDLNLNAIPGAHSVTYDSHDGPGSCAGWDSARSAAAACVRQSGLRPAGLEG